jgi:NADH-quinone oxidoreductase subunit H
LGGWNGPLAIMSDKIIGVIPGLGLAGQPNAWGFIAGCVGAANFIMKATIGVTVMIWVRWTLPRLRIDQVMTMCLKYCVPLAAACFLGAVFVKAEIFGLGYLSVDAWLPGLRSDRVEVREGWMTEVEGEGVTLSTEKTLVHGDG